MQLHDPRDAAITALPANPARPATSLLLDTPDLRLVVFRLAPGQEVPAHTSTSSVTLQVIGGRGLLSGGDGEVRQCAAGQLVTYEPNEPHSMRAVDEELLLLATITPRPGGR